MKHIRVTTKLWLGVAGIVLGAIFIVGHAGYNSASHQKKFNQQDSLLSLRLDQASQWSALTQTNIARTQAMLVSNDPQERAEFATEVASAELAIKELQRSLNTDHPSSSDRSALQQLSALQKTMETERSQALEQQSNGNTDAARQIARNQLRSAANAYIQALNNYVHEQAQNLAQMRSDMGAARQGVVRAAALNMAVLMIGIALGAWLLIESHRVWWRLVC